MTEYFDVIVIGGGLAGLAAARTARLGGASVVVLEAHGGGGRARTTTKDGFSFNLGGHALYIGGAGGEALAALSIRPEGSPPPLGRYQLLKEGRMGVMPSTAGTLARCGLLSWRSKAQLGSALARLAKIDASRLAGTSMEQWMQNLELHSDVEDVIRALVRLSTYSADMSALGADAGVAQLQLGASSGVLYLHGGWGQLLAAFGAGQEVRIHCPVRALREEAGRIEVQLDNGSLVGGSAVVAVGGPGATARLLPGSIDWGELGGPVTAACLDAAVDHHPAPGYVLSLDRPLYASTQGPPARLAPPGAAVMSVVKYGTGSPDVDRAELETHMRVAGVTIEGVLHQRFLATMVVAETSCRAELGGLEGRPSISATGVPGAFMAGDWVGPAGLLAGASIASGHAAGLAALRHITTTASRQARNST
ncbi:FAD-dependent oxidoreductase [Ferrimicrobium sp.]|uniref:FAD-dependent oxidoreductase n=1 Tax=Ferrimicrobium sp. TaxID=2926050 RepID=UPI0026268B9D|nr:FAD-dependent oxidoreductase [Ferrimicrobium sp.]